MPVVSVSLGEEDIANLDRIQEEFALKGRSDAVRAAVRTTVSDLAELHDMAGNVEGVLITVRHDHSDPWLSAIQMRYEGLVTTQLHSHLRDRKCLEVMILSGEAESIRSMLLEIQASGKADYVRFVRRRVRIGLVPIFRLF